MIRFRTLSSILIFAAIGAANPVLAGQNDSRRVQYADLNLNTPAGIAALDARIDQAINEVCRGSTPYQLSDLRDVRRCRTDTRAAVRGARSNAIAQARRGNLDLASR